MKRFFDFLASFLGILLIWPILLAITILIRVKMPGAPAIFRQQRVGQYGKLFTMYKFRTMKPDHHGSSVSVAGENRITPLGAILRRYKLDELPELWNILCGDMSFVGPRPDVPGYADLLQGDDREILLLRPGITGPASLKYRHEEELLAEQSDPVVYNNTIIWPDKVRINRYYLHHQSWRTDLQIILATILEKNMKYNDEII